MDPNKNLTTQLLAAASIQQLVDNAPDEGLTPEATMQLIALAEELADHVSSLHAWIVKGGALPDMWGAIRVKINLVRYGEGAPDKVADAELHFTGGQLDGTKLIGFMVWKRRSDGNLNVTFPARSYSVNGERRCFALLRPIFDESNRTRLADLVKDAYTTAVALEAQTA